MSTSVTMPALGESVTEGTVTQWLKKEGDTVEVDEPLLEVSTDKVDTEVPSPVAGVVLKIVAPEDSEVEIGGELAIIGDPSETSETPAEPTPAPAAEPAEEPASEPERPAAEPPAAEQSAPAQQPSDASAGSSEGTEVVLPELGESVTEGTVTAWLKSVGDNVEVDEPLLEISTDKVDTEIPSPAAGTLLDIKIGEDETAEVGSVLAIIGSGTAAPAATPKPKPSAEPRAEETPAEAAEKPTPEPEAPASAPPQVAPQATPTPTPSEAPTKPGSSYVTPLVRKLASENDVNLDEVTGTGVGGRIRKQDVQNVIEQRMASKPTAAPEAEAAPAAPAAPVEVSPLRGRTEKLSRLRQTAAKALHESMTTMAQLTTVREVDVTKVAKLRAAKKDEFLDRHGVKLSFLPFFSVAAIEALQQYPIINASMNLEEKTVTYPAAENVAFAVDTPKGLLTPVVKNAGDLNLPGLAKRIAEVADKARNGGLSPDDLYGGTFTITNTGSVGALFDTPIVPLGQSAILGTAAIVKRPRVVNDPDLGEVVAVRSVMHLTLSYDHRLIDGADAARYLAAVTKRIEEGNFEHQLGL
ncbi:2-oxoglutarate dehydrogenase, E2 component, dihydrolipoamide succinyltransferase [Glycomyces halotolerans]